MRMYVFFNPYRKNGMVWFWIRDDTNQNFMLKSWKGKPSEVGKRTRKMWIYHEYHVLCYTLNPHSNTAEFTSPWVEGTTLHDSGAHSHTMVWTAWQYPSNAVYLYLKFESNSRTSPSPKTHMAGDKLIKILRKILLFSRYKITKPSLIKKWEVVRRIECIVN